MTTGVINGTLLRLYIGGNAVAYATSSTLDLTTALRETIHKDNPGSGDREVEPGQKSGTCSFEALYSEDGDNNDFAELFDAWKDRTKLTCMISTEVAGDTKYTFEAYLTSLSSTGPVEENATFSGTLEITGSITKAAIT
jgi:hypothetical protein